MDAKTIETWCREVSAKASTAGVDQLRVSFGLLVFGLAVVASICAVIIFLYLRCDSSTRADIPRHFLAMVACLLCSSLAGMFAWLVYMQALANYYLASGSYSTAEDFRLIAVNFYWFSLFAPVYPWFAVLNCSAKLIVLRLFFTTFLGNSSDIDMPGASDAVHRVFHSFLAAVALLFCGSVIAWSVSSWHAGQASAYFHLAASNSSDITARNQATQQFSLLNQAQAFGNHLESSYLLLISVAFVLVGFFSARRMQKHVLSLEMMQTQSPSSARGTSALRRVMIMAALVSLRRSNSVVFTTSLFILVSYLINAAFAVTYSIADAGVYNSTCPTLCDATCQDPDAMLNHILRLTPALTAAVLLLSLVLAPLVALINMMRGRIWYVLVNRKLPILLYAAA
jgi:hypothetical protein